MLKGNPFTVLVNQNQNQTEEFKMENLTVSNNTDNDVVQTMQQLEESIEKESTNMAHLAIKKTYGEALAKMITASNYNAELGENEDYYLIHAPYIRVVRSDVENVLGAKLPATRWRMIFAHRQGELKTFNDYEFAIGNPVASNEPDESREETAQVNTRLPISIKKEMDDLKDMLGWSQNTFIAQAIVEFVEKLKQEI